MKLYKNKIYSRLFYLVMPVLLLINILIPIYNGTDITSAFISITGVFIIAGIGFYYIYKQSVTPLFEITKNLLIINDIRIGKKEIFRDSITGIRKNKFFGYKLFTLSANISIPLGSLNTKDRNLFLSTLKLKI